MVVIRALNIALPQKGALEFNFMLRIMENKKFNYSRDICFISRNLVKLLELQCLKLKRNLLVNFSSKNMHN